MSRGLICAVVFCVIQSATAALAADVQPAATLPAVTSAQESDWTGFHIGAHLGVGWGELEASLDRPFDSYELDGPQIGGQLGYSYQISDFVFGVEGDFTLSNLEDAASRTREVAAGKGGFGTTYTAKTSYRMDLGLDWMATVRARAGLNLNRVLLFGTGGLAIGRIASELEVFSEETFYPENITRWTRTSGSHRETNLGWTAGAGAEVLVGRRVSVRGEYLYTAIGQDSVPFADELPYHFDESVTEDSDADIDLKLHTVRAGINMRF